MTAGFPDLRAFLDRLRRDRDLVEITAPVDAHLEAAEIHRRVIAAGGPALLFTNVRGARFPLVTNLFGTPRRAELAFGTRPHALIERLVHIAETLLPPTPAKLWGARDVGRELLRVGHAARRRAARSPRSSTRDVRLDRLPVAHVLARGRRAVRHAAARLHRASRRHGPQPRHVPPAGPRSRARPACTGRSARAAASTTPSPKRAAQALPVTVFLGGPPALILSAIAPLPENVPELMLASLIAGERLPLVAGPRPASARRRRRVRADRRGAARACAGPRGRSAITTATTRCGTTTRCSRSSSSRAASDAIYPGDGRRQAAAGGLLHRRPAAGAAVAAVPAGDAGGARSCGRTARPAITRWPAAVVRERYGREAMASAFRILGEGQLSLTKFLLADRSAGRPARTSAPRSSTCWRARVPRPTSTCSRTCRWTRSTTPGPTVNEGSKGVWLGLGDPVRDAAARVPRRRDAAAGRHRRARLLRRLPRRRRAAATRTSRTPPRGSPRIRRSPAGRWSS